MKRGRDREGRINGSFFKKAIYAARSTLSNTRPAGRENGRTTTTQCVHFRAPSVHPVSALPGLFPPYIVLSNPTRINKGGEEKEET